MPAITITNTSSSPIATPIGTIPPGGSLNQLVPQEAYELLQPQLTAIVNESLGTVAVNAASGSSATSISIGNETISESGGNTLVVSTVNNAITLPSISTAGFVSAGGQISSSSTVVSGVGSGSDGFRLSTAGARINLNNGSDFIFDSAGFPVFNAANLYGGGAGTWTLGPSTAGQALTLSTQSGGALNLNPNGSVVMSPGSNLVAIGGAIYNLGAGTSQVTTVGTLGVQAVVANTAPRTGKTAADTNFITVTSPNDGAKHTYAVSGAIKITTLGSGNINLQVAFTDHAGAAQTLNIPLTTAGTAVASATTAAYYMGLPVYITVNPNTAINISTAGTFTSCTYDDAATITQLN